MTLGEINQLLALSERKETKMDKQTLKDAIEIAGLLRECDKSAPDVNPRPVIVRSREAGVLFGNYAGNEGSTIRLTDAVQMWRWKAAKGGTLVDCAEFGVDKSGCKFSHAKSNLTVFNACALIDCTEDAAKSISGVDGGDWK